MNTMLSLTRKAALAAAMLSITISGVANAEFALVDQPGSHLDITFDGKTVARFMYAFDQSTEARLLETYKPYLHVFDAEGKAPITKGPGGQYPHHRGIYIGWNKIQFNGARHDLWHMKGVYQIHQHFVERIAEADSARVTARIHWIDPEGTVIIEEDRTMAFAKPAAPGLLVVDFSSTLRALNGDVELNGDPEHAGVQYRPADEVDRAATIYAFPKENADPKKDRDYPWVGETYTLGDKQYSVVHINHPENPKDTIYSAYRDYGRFGAFFIDTVEDGEGLTVQYRFLIKEGVLPSLETIGQYSDLFASGKSELPHLGAAGTPATSEAGEKK